MHAQLPGTLFTFLMNVFYNPQPKPIPIYEPFQFNAIYVPYTGAGQNSVSMALVGNVTIGNPAVTYRMHLDVPTNMDTVLIGERAGLPDGTAVLNNSLKYVLKDSSAVLTIAGDSHGNTPFLAPSDAFVDDCIHTGVNNETIKQTIKVLSNFSQKGLQDYFESAPFDGVLSLRSVPFGNTTSFLNTTLIGRNESNVVTFWMQGKNANDRALLTFGKIDSDHCNSNWSEVPQIDHEKGLWTFKIRTISFNRGTMLPDKSFIQNVNFTEQKVIANPYIEGQRNGEHLTDDEMTYRKDMTDAISTHPVDQIAAINIGQASSKAPMKHLLYMADVTGAKKLKKEYPYYTVSCTGHNYHLLMGLENNQTLVLAPSDYIIEMRKGECFLAFQEDTSPALPGSPTWTLGGHFFSERCVALDIKKNTISFTAAIPNGSAA
ncbi:eukaryotic aspartyl protease domain-containing protein [Ditylenchus destructor]|nr:eukaryotic aspartyl protease domain-containing protein [Ditylenchus destructor]